MKNLKQIANELLDELDLNTGQWRANIEVPVEN
jgi:hypothetical protein